MKTQFIPINGFTLIELLICIAIIGILASVLIPNVLQARSHAQQVSARTYARQMATWANSWLTEQPNRRVDDLNSSCTNSMYVAQGGSASFPSWVADCEVQSKGDGTFLVKVTMLSGQTATFE